MKLEKIGQELIDTIQKMGKVGKTQIAGAVAGAMLLVMALTGCANPMASQAQSVKPDKPKTEVEKTFEQLLYKGILEIIQNHGDDMVAHGTKLADEWSLPGEPEEHTEQRRKMMIREEFIARILDVAGQKLGEGMGVEVIGTVIQRDGAVVGFEKESIRKVQDQGEFAAPPRQGLYIANLITSGIRPTPSLMEFLMAHPNGPLWHEIQAHLDRFPHHAALWENWPEIKTLPTGERKKLTDFAIQTTRINSVDIPHNK